MRAQAPSDAHAVVRRSTLGQTKRLATSVRMDEPQRRGKAADNDVEPRPLDCRILANEREPLRPRDALAHHSRRPN